MPLKFINRLVSAIPRTRTAFHPVDKYRTNCGFLFVDSQLCFPESPFLRSLRYSLKTYIFCF
jgi:hypothetical protein